MSNPSPEATLLLQKYTNVQIAERCVELESDLKERTDQYHLAHGRETINEDLADEFNKLVLYVRAKNKLEELSGTAEGSAFEKCWDEIGDAYQELSDTTKKAIETD